VDSSVTLRHRTQLQHAAIFSTEAQIRRSHYREGDRLSSTPNNMSRDHGFCLSKSRRPAICSLKGHRKPPLYDGMSGFFARPRRSAHIAFIMALASLHISPDKTCSLLPYRMLASHLKTPVLVSYWFALRSSENQEVLICPMCESMETEAHTHI
jgi:hypothetical protein